MKIIENVTSKNMWPTTTYTFTVNNIDNEYIKNKVLEREQKGLGFRFDPIQGGGWQSNKDLLDYEFSFLKKSLLMGVNEILSQIYVDDASIKMINSWANISRKGECTMPHIHEESSWSCVYYVTPTEDANLYLKDPRLLEQMDKSHHFLKQPYANTIRKRPFNEGEAILFPSWLEHGVGAGTKDAVRISIACNFLIEG
jgi:uncharacterized protein (TIGR02466 family)